MVFSDSREVGTITYTNLTIHVFAVAPTALTDPKRHEVVKANEHAVYVLFNETILKALADDIVGSGHLDSKDFHRYVLEIANGAALEHLAAE